MPTPPDQKPSQSGIDKTIPKADQGPYNYTLSQAATTLYGSSMAKPSEYDTESRLTTYTYTSQADAQKFLKKVDNRSFNVLSETYFLPTDDAEWSRLDKQHIAFKMGIQGLCPDMHVVRAVLAPEAGITKRILDLGCGTGIWSHEMAMDFPHCRVIGVDIAPTPVDVENVPTNCTFEIDDVNNGLDHFRDQFDLCHSRLLAAGLQDFRKTMQEAHSCLKPGGMAVWFDVDYQLMTSDRHVYLAPASEENPSGSWTARLFYEARRVAVQSGRSDIYGMAEAMDEGLWNDPLIDPETCKAASLYLPIGPWLEGSSTHETQQLKYIGSILRQDFMVTHRTLHILLKKGGWSPEVLNQWSQNADDELMEMKMPILLRMRLAWGRRRASPGEPAPPLPPLNTAGPTTDEEIDDSQAFPYPHFFIYDTREQSLKEAELRKKGETFAPPPGPPA